jgi:4-amino-4-deoxy-L-arabinose transferase-like glycosyltransferase
VNQISARSARLILAVILVLGFGIRLTWALHQSSDDAAINRLPDQREYLDLGKNLFGEAGLSMADARFEQIVYAFRTPGYPFVIACCGANPPVVRTVQCVLDTTTILAIFLLARRWLSPAAAVFAAAIVAFNPYMIFFTGLILSETLFTTMLCWAMALLILSDGPWPDGNKLLAWLGGGALLAIAVLVRPGTLLLPVVIGCGAALANRLVIQPYQRGARWPLPVVATMLLLTGLAIFPWAARNRWVLGSWVWTSTNDGITRYDGFNPDATGASDQSFVQSMPWTKDMTEVARSRYFAKMADDWIEANPSAAVRLAGVKIARTWSPIPLSAEYGGRWIYRAAGIGYGLPLDLLVILGLRQTNLTGAAKRFLLLPALYFTVAAGLSVGSLRYRIPAEAPMAILAAGAVRSARRS